MRCPKCGFISFDHLETCKKCHKYIGDIIAQINGTTYDAVVPTFLSVTSTDRSVAPHFAQPAGEEEVAPRFEDEKEFKLDESAEREFVLDQEFEPALQHHEIEFPGGNTDLVMELDDIAEISPRDEFTLDLGEQPQSPLPTVDFGKLDISDLAPPVKEQPEEIRFEEQLVLSDLEPIAALSAPSPPASSSPAKNPSGLEDLNFNGLDLDTPAKLVSGSAAGKRFLPSVKTGTALDKFDIDLGELFSDNKK